MQISPRIVLIHALEESVIPSRLAVERMWPEVRAYDLLDTSLAADVAAKGKLDESIIERFLSLAAYAERAGRQWDPLRGILFTCSAFGPAIDAARAKLTIPVLKPNEAAFQEAIGLGSRIGLLVSFLPSLDPLRKELLEEALRINKQVHITGILAVGALDALKSGNAELHDEIVAETARSMKDIDVLILGQFSLERASERVKSVLNCPVITTPSAAVRSLRSLVA